MAGAGDKKRVKENAAHLTKLQLLIGGANVAFVLIRLVLRGATASKLLYAGFALTGLLYAACYKSIASSLAPVYGPGGELVFIGDLSTGGVLSYFHDVLYITIFVQLLGCWTDKAWWTFMLIPAFAAYMLVVHVVLPWWNTPKLSDGGPETEVERKRREKRERQEARAAKFNRR